MTNKTLSILDPIKEEDFFQDYFEKKALLISRDNPNYFDKLVRLQDIDDIINSDYLYYPTINLEKKGGEAALQPWLDKIFDKQTLKVNQGELYKQVAEGQTLIINTIEKFLPKLNQFMVAQGKRWGMHHSANTYITPANNQGFNWHYDSHDVFILQIKGSKTWFLKEEETFLPDANFKSKSPQIKEPENHTKIFLEAGDTLYIPRGIYHKAQTEDIASTHITLSANTIKAYRLFDDFLQEARKEKLFRQSIVPSNVSTLNKEEIITAAKKFAIDYFSKLDLESTEELWEQSLASKATPSNRNRLLSILNLDSLNIDSKVKRNPDIVLDISTSLKFIEIKANGKKLKYPIFMQKHINQLLSTKTIALNELAANIPEKHALDLAKKFIIEGFITIES
jgi:ribosomal protein L16 Arg81 hydroxylase